LAFGFFSFGRFGFLVFGFFPFRFFPFIFLELGGILGVCILGGGQGGGSPQTRFFRVFPLFIGLLIGEKVKD